MLIPPFGSMLPFLALHFRDKAEMNSENDSNSGGKTYEIKYLYIDCDAFDAGWLRGGRACHYHYDDNRSPARNCYYGPEWDGSARSDYYAPASGGQG
jgi:hypothetical protein